MTGATTGVALTALLFTADSPNGTGSLEQSDCDAAITAIGGLPSFAITAPAVWPIVSPVGYLFTLGTITYV